jgi:hypothetical protein
VKRPGSFAAAVAAWMRRQSSGDWSSLRMPQWSWSVSTATSSAATFRA